jgi:hypothetical protein
VENDTFLSGIVLGLNTVRGRGVWQAPLKMEKMYDGWMILTLPYIRFFLPEKKKNLGEK